MHNAKCIICVLAVILLNGCVGCFDILERTYWSDREYSVQDDPGSDCKTLYRQLEGGNGIGRIPCITQLGYNEQYIVGESYDAETTSFKQYWILNKAFDNDFNNAQEIVEGPFTEQQFEIRKNELGLKSLKFTREWR